ncbi:MAG: Mov34/MPN/PAD-1 family protein [Nanoarchaeota archaeon]
MTNELELKILNALDERPANHTTSSFRITRGAYRKMMLTAKAVGQLAGGGMECYGYLVNPVDSPEDTITDIYLAADQDTQSAHVRVTEEGVHEASQSLEPAGYKIVGWWHSHGSFEPFHSSTDKNNFETVLHSIAPRTMFRPQKGRFVYDAQRHELITDDVTIRGIDLEGKTDGIEITQRVQQDPYAYSCVVNMAGHRYLERITKTYNPRTREFDLNTPTHPSLELIAAESDVTVSISAIEDDITTKISMHTNGDTASSARHGPSNKDTVDAFYRRAIELAHAKDPNAEHLLNYARHITNNPLIPSDSPPTSLRAARRQARSRFDGVNATYSLERSYDIGRLRDEINLHFMRDATAAEPDKIAGILEGYQSVAKMVERHFNLAVRAAKAISQYSMNRYTDANGTGTHRYTNLAANIANTLNSADYVSATSAISKAHAYRNDEAADQLLLYHDRLRVVNNIMTSLVFDRNERRHMAFLEGIATAYETGTDGAVDGAIEEHLVPGMGAAATAYQDRANYRREGILFDITRHLSRRERRQHERFARTRK